MHGVCSYKPERQTEMMYDGFVEVRLSFRSCLAERVPNFLYQLT